MQGEQVASGGEKPARERGRGGVGGWLRALGRREQQRSPRPSTEMPRVRAMAFDFDDTVPHRWFWDSPQVTQLANALHLIFPDGERFFVRSVRRYLDQVEDPDLRARVKAFFGQEGRHGHEHERTFRMLESQGYVVRRFLRIYRFLAYRVIERAAPDVLKLSTTAALEHFTATLAHHALTEDFLEGAHPSMRDLLRWHAAEEIEHKAVAFDVLRAVDPRYGVRLAGMAMASVTLLGFWALGAVMLLEQEAARVGRAELRRAAKALQSSPRLRDERNKRRDLLGRAVLDYLRPDFHPDDVDDYELSRAYLASIGRLEG